MSKTTISTAHVTSISKSDAAYQIDGMSYNVQSIAISSDTGEMFIAGPRTGAATYLDGQCRILKNPDPVNVNYARAYRAIAGHANGMCYADGFLYISSSPNSNGVGEGLDPNIITVVNTATMNVIYRYAANLPPVEAYPDASKVRVSGISYNADDGYFYVDNGTGIYRTTNTFGSDITEIRGSGLFSAFSEDSGFTSSDVVSQSSVIWNGEYCKIYSIRNSSGILDHGAMSRFSLSDGSYLGWYSIALPTNIPDEGCELESATPYKGNLFFIAQDVGGSDIRQRIFVYSPDNSFNKDDYHMSVSVKNKFYPGAELTATDMSVLMESLSQHDDGIIEGVEVHAAATDTIRVTSGYILIHGRLLYVEGGTQSFTLPSERTKYIVLLTCDLSSGEDPTISIVEDDGTTYTDSSSFNTSNGVAYLAIGWFTASSAGFNSVTMKPLMPHHSVIGRITSASMSEATTLSSANTYYNLASISLEPGMWLLVATAHFGGITGGTGHDTLQIYDSTNEASIRSTNVQHSVNASVTANVITTKYFSYSDSTIERGDTLTVTLRASAQTAGRTIQTPCVIFAIRLY